MASKTSSLNSEKRLRIIIILVPFFAFCLLARLFYWQVIRGPELQTKAGRQHETTTYLKAKRGDVLDSEGNVLAGTKNLYNLFVYKPQLEINQVELINKISPLITPDPESTAESSMQDYLLKRISLESNWVSLKHYLSPEEKQSIENLKIQGIGFDDEFVRYYPEASMAAQTLGFVGQDIAGQEQGYFGIEGYFDRQLKGRSGKIRTEIDAKGNPILVGNYQFLKSIEGRSITTTIDRKIQYLTENLLKDGIAKYQASAGNVIILESKTGKVRAMASFPNYDPGIFSEFPANTYKNPNVADLFEPGSIFKVLVMAAGINEKVVDPNTVCDICAGPVTIGKYSIKTWDNTYRPNSTMTDVIIHSDNTGMVFVAQKLGKDKFADYLKKYGFGNKTGIELQDEVKGSTRDANEFGDIDLATESFGQGIAVTPIQMVAAVNTIANDGYYLPPTLVEDSNNLSEKKQILSHESVQKITNIMVQAVDKGEAKWAKPKGISIAGKTGTAQIPIEGHYDAAKTNASFIGFFPAENPQYTMLVTLKEPQTSQWGSETAAPLWFNIAKQLLL